jgi:hypothetical protein
MDNKRPNMRLFVGDSADFNKLCKPGFADVVFIDGNHHEEWVRRDAHYAQIFGKRIIAFHDYNAEPYVGIMRVVEEVKARGWHEHRLVYTTLTLAKDE